MQILLLSIIVSFLVAFSGGQVRAGQDGTTRVYDLNGRFVGTIQLAKASGRSQFSALPSQTIITSRGVQSRLAAGIYFTVPADQDTDFSSNGKDQWVDFRDVTRSYLPQQEWDGGGIRVGDVNGDGREDIVFARTTATCDNDSTEVWPRVWIQNVRGDFVDETEDRMPPIYAPIYDLTLFDADGDGDLDLFIGGYSCGSHGRLASLLMNDGLGVFHDESEQRLPQRISGLDFVYFAAKGQLVADNSPDLVVTVFGPDTSMPHITLRPELWINDGRGFFARDTMGRLPRGGKYGFFIPFIEDVDADSLNDILFANLRLYIKKDDPIPIDSLSGQTAYYRNTGNGFFADETSFRTPSAVGDGARTLAIGDIDNDSYPEIVEIGFLFGAARNQQVRLFKNNGAGYFSVSPGAFPDGLMGWFNDAKLGRIDGDAFADLFMVKVMPGEPSYDVLLRNRGDGRFVDASSSLPRNLDFSISAALFDHDGDGDLDLVIANNGPVMGGTGQNRLYHNLSTGATWIQLESGATANLHDVVMVDALVAFAVGDNGTILRTTNAGTDWVRLETGTEAALNAVDAISIYHVYAVGDGVVLSTTDGGESWKKKSVYGNFTSIGHSRYWGIDVYAGSEEGVLSRENDTGWTALREFAGGSILAIGFRFAPFNTHALDIATQEYFYSSVKEATGFDSVSLPVLRPYEELRAGSLQFWGQFLVGFGGDPAPRPIILRRDAAEENASWDRVPNDLPWSFVPNDVEGITGSKVFLCGSNGSLYTSTDSGTTWMPHLTGTNRELRGMSFLDEHTGMVVGDSGLILYTSGDIPISPITIRVPQDQPTIQSAIGSARDGDTILVDPGTYRERINFLGKNITVASMLLTTGNGSYIDQTVLQPDSGTVVTFENGETLASLLMGFTITGGTGTDGQGGGILIRRSSPTIRHNHITGNSLWACGSRGGGIAILDSSSPWIVRNTIMKNIADGPCDCVCYFGGGVFIDVSAHPILGGSAADGNNIFQNNALRGMQAYRQDSGLTIDARFNYWGSCPPGIFDVLPEDQFDVSHCSDSIILGSGSPPGVEIPKEYLLEQNYPNPFNPTTVIRYAIPKAEFVVLKVFDLLGREVITLVNEPKASGVHHIEWDGSGASSGVYLYRLQAGTFNRAMKLLLLR